MSYLILLVLFSFFFIFFVFFSAAVAVLNKNKKNDPPSQAHSTTDCTYCPDHPDGCFSFPLNVQRFLLFPLFFCFRFLSFSYYWIIKGITVHLVDCSTLPKVVDKLFDVEVSKFGPARHRRRWGRNGGGDVIK